MKIVHYMHRWVFILCLPVLLLSASLAWGFNSEWMFNYGFEKYRVSSVTGLSSANLNKIASSWISYIDSNQEYWDIVIEQDGKSFTLFTQDEQLHFKDVKSLVWLDYKVGLVTLLLCLSYIIYTLKLKNRDSYRRLAGGLTIGSALSIALILLLGAASFLDFDSLFLGMHRLIFTNNFWYAEGYMLELFPGGFWYDAAFICIGMMAGLTLIIGGFGLVYSRSRDRIN